jgi:ferredoxin-NADP reductase
MSRKIFSLEIIKKYRETPDSCSFTLRITDELKSQFQFISGQYLTVHLIDKNGVQHSRHYSICSLNNSQGISFCVKRVRDGLVSNLLCDGYSVGTLQVSPPTGDFILNDTILEDYRNLVFITGGSGITPIKSMIDQALANNFKGNIFLIYANRDVSSIIFHQHLMDIQRDKCQFVYAVDNPTEGWTGEVGRLTSSKVEEIFQKFKIPYKGTCFFLTGPPVIIENAINHLKTNEVYKTDIKLENFFISVSSADLSTETHSVKIRNKRRTQTISIPPNQNILDAALNAGIDIKHSCKVGNCQSCVAVLKSGKVYSTIKHQNNSNKIITCQSFPLDDMVVVDYDKSILQTIFANRNTLIIASLLLSFFLFLFFIDPSNESYLAKGYFNTGHDNLKCVACHKAAQGTTRQQLQSNSMSFLNFNHEYVSFGSLEVGNNECLDCHTRPNDVHPTHRFLEPKFAEARMEIHPENCNSCHNEHSGRRVTIEVNFCKNCHQEIKINNDPLGTSHEQLISSNQWNTCLQCHDFHGNHIFEPATRMKDTFILKSVETYFEGGEDPYGAVKKYITDSLKITN